MIAITGVDSGRIQFELRNGTSSAFTYWGDSFVIPHDALGAPFPLVQTLQDGEWVSDPDGEQSWLLRCGLDSPAQMTLLPGDFVTGSVSLSEGRFPMRLSLLVAPIAGDAPSSMRVVSKPIT